MPTRPPRAFRLRHLPAVALCALVLTTGCSGQGSSGASASDGAVVLESSPDYVTFQNKSGLTLSDVRIVIVPYGPGEFSRELSRVENTGRRQVPLNEFRGKDGTPLNLRVARPKLVRVTAQDSTGKSYAHEIAWK